MKCKTCYGRAYIGYAYDPKNIVLDEEENRKKGKKIPCPKYAQEVEKALKLHVLKVIGREDEERRLADSSKKKSLLRRNLPKK